MISLNTLQDDLDLHKICSELLCMRERDIAHFTIYGKIDIQVHVCTHMYDF